MISWLILFLVSTLPIFLLGLYIYNHDKNKEPIKLLIKLFIGGIFSCFLVWFIDDVLGIFFPIFLIETDKLNLIENIVKAFICVALVEEFSKLLFVYLISYKNKNFGELYDMIVYAVFVSLGFAFLENMIYVYSTGIVTGIARAISAIPGHVCFGVFMGYYLGIAKIADDNKKYDLKKKNLFFSLLVPTILHGIYDYCLFTGNILFFIIFIIFVIFVFIKSVKKVRRVSSLKAKKRYKDNFCPNCGISVNSDFCPNCGRKNDYE